MTYNPAIPNAGDTLALSQPQILTNFQQANTIFAADHVGFTDVTVANRGKHKWTKFVLQVADPALAGTDCALYTFNVGATPNLFWRRPGGGAGFSIVGRSTPLIAPIGYTILPGNLLLQWGIQAGVPAGAGPAINFPVPFSVAPYSIICTLLQPSATTGRTIDVLSGSVLAGSFRTTINPNTSGGAHEIYWMAIGQE